MGGRKRPPSSLQPSTPSDPKRHEQVESEVSASASELSAAPIGTALAPKTGRAPKYDWASRAGIGLDSSSLELFLYAAIIMEYGMPFETRAALAQDRRGTNDGFIRAVERYSFPVNELHLKSRVNHAATESLGIIVQCLRHPERLLAGGAVRDPWMLRDASFSASSLCEFLSLQLRAHNPYNRKDRPRFRAFKQQVSPPSSHATVVELPHLLGAQPGGLPPPLPPRSSSSCSILS